MNKDNQMTIFDENEEFMTLTTEDGEEKDFELLAELDYEGKMYAYLQPTEDDPDYVEDEVYVFELMQDEDGSELVLEVEDEELMEKLVNMLNDELAKL
ncbi:MAG: DUF1292 domain-containing protein [Clostridia bacterium]|nr:DUF1292 domain-containing protein [Clostridia bacterium]